jgi:hypothetical protein
MGCLHTYDYSLYFDDDDDDDAGIAVYILISLNYF